MRAVLPLLLALAVVLPAPRAASSPVQRGDEPEVGRELAARAGADALTFEELDELILDRQGRSQDGREALLHLLKSRVLEALERERGLRIDDSSVEARWKELDRESRQAGEDGGLAGMLERSRIDPKEFRRFLRLSIVQETLARRALGIGAGQPVSAEQQEMWLEGVLAERGLEELDPERSGGLLVRCADVEVSRADFARHLRGQIGADELREACYQLLLHKKLRARLTDLDPRAVERAVDEELERRRREAQTDPRFAGLAYEQLLATQGMSLDTLRRDPTVRIAALARLWVERQYDAARLREVYLTERERYDAQYGEALELSALVLRAGRFRNEFVPRTFEEAETVLRDLAREIRGRADFERLVELRTEEPESRERRGLLGYATRGDERIPAPLRGAAFAQFDKGTYTPGSPADDPRARLVGPVQVPGGCVLLWIGDRRPAPVWEVMAGHVRAERRRAFVDGVLRPDQVFTFLDRP